MANIVDAAKQKLGLGDDWRWCLLTKCSARGVPVRRGQDANTGYSLVKLRQEATGAITSVVMADREWKDTAEVPHA